MRKIATVFRLIVSPQATWSRIFKSSSSASLERTMYYPLVGLLAVSSFMILVYNPMSTLHMAIIGAVMEFVAFFLGYVVASFLISILLPKLQQAGKVTTDGRVRTFVIYNMSILVLIELVRNLLPTDDMPLLYIFTLYILYVIFRSVKFFSLESDKEAVFTVCAFLIIVALPYVVLMLINKLMPSL